MGKSTILFLLSIVVISCLLIEITAEVFEKPKEYDAKGNEIVDPDTPAHQQQQHHHHRLHRGKVHRRRQPVCVNGRPVDGACECELDFVGKHCEKQKHCQSFRRYRNGSCPECIKGYQGEFCEEIVCYNGKQNVHLTECECDDPYSGKHCDELETRKIYSYYNRKVFLLGPLGAISLIPMCTMYLVCEYFARKRQVKRVGLMMEGQNINVENRLLEKLLNKM